MHKRLTLKRKNDCSSGFTLIELLVAMAIMAIILSITLASYFGFGRGARLRGSVNSLRGKIALARQFAVVHATDIELRFVDPADAQHHYYIYDVGNGYMLGETNFVPVGVEFGVLPDDSKIPFKPTGDAGTAETYEVELIENGVNSVFIEVYGLTGLMYVQE